MMLGQSMDAGGAPSGGVPWRVVKIESIAPDGSHVLARDVNGKALDVQMRVRGTKAPLPRVGERWVVDRSLGDWALMAYLDEQDPPEVTGSRLDSNEVEVEALANLLALLEEMGLITNHTNDDPRW